MRASFIPRRAAARKYREFSSGPDAIDVPLAESEPGLDTAEEAAEQRRARRRGSGEISAANRRLGSGVFGTVGKPSASLNTRSDGSLRDAVGTRADSCTARPAAASESEDSDRVWRRTKGADDLLDLTLRYEHVMLIAATLRRISARACREPDVIAPRFSSRMERCVFARPCAAPRCAKGSGAGVACVAGNSTKRAIS